MSSFIDKVDKILKEESSAPAAGSLYNHSSTAAAGKKKRAPRKKVVEEVVDVVESPCKCQKKAAKSAQAPAPVVSEGVLVAGKKRRVVSEETKLKRKAGAAQSPWIAHVKEVAKSKGIKYGDALKIAKESYKGKK